MQRTVPHASAAHEPTNDLAGSVFPCMHETAAAPFLCGANSCAAHPLHTRHASVRARGGGYYVRLFVVCMRRRCVIKPSSAVLRRTFQMDLFPSSLRGRSRAVAYGTRVGRMRGMRSFSLCPQPLPHPQRNAFGRFSYPRRAACTAGTRLCFKLRTIKSWGSAKPAPP